MRFRGGFTLIELLVTISIIAVLAALGLGASNQVRLRGDRTAALSNLQQIGIAIALYAGENNQVLPGPLFPGQIPVYDASRTGRLPVMLAQYLGINPLPAPFLVNVFVPPAYRRNLPPGTTLENDRTLVMNMHVVNATETINPWGSLATGIGAPMPVTRIENPASVWAVSDADQQHPDVIGAPWRSSTPVKPIHGSYRTALFFDGHATTMALTDFLQ
jgi:prepilin-type N-terminal cleavage/methylation domain-containing protein/prepilin-type processing-associated H-X9-DG protein